MVVEFETEIKELLVSVTGFSDEQINLERPKDTSLGDFAFPCFMLSKERKKSPQIIAQELAKEIEAEIDKICDGHVVSDVVATGPYVNFFVDTCVFADNILRKIVDMKGDIFDKEKYSTVLVESPAPNTNKPLHLGHIRNGLTGETIINLLRRAGRKVVHVDLVNDRGVHICKSMLAYKLFGNGETPESTGMKSDHFVGKYYVEFAKRAKNNPELEKDAQQMLVDWENGDKDVRALWEKMNSWTLLGMKTTYTNLGLRIDKTYYESDIYLEGKEIITDGFKSGVFTKTGESDGNEGNKNGTSGAIMCDLEDVKLGKKILLRADGTSIYMTQDIALAKARYDEYNMSGMIYVVGNEQEHHFKVLFEIFKRLGYKFSKGCYHMSYGMVELPDGKMKSREGKIVDADDLITEVVQLAKGAILERYNDLSDEEINHRARVIGIGALKFFFMRNDALKNFVFNPKESISFEGETAPYIQYAYARISSIINKSGIDYTDPDFSLLSEVLEKDLISMLGRYKETVIAAANGLKPHIVSKYLIELAQKFNEYYHNVSILKESNNDVIKSRLYLIDAVRIIIKDALSIFNIEVLEQM